MDQELLQLENEISDLLFKNFGYEHFNPGLGRISTALTLELEIFKLAQKEKRLKIITIAGTNGKGETTYEIEKLLRNAGKNTARWISPHIYSINERISFNGIDINLKDLKSEILQGIEDVKKNSYQLSFYEFLFFIFCRVASRKISQIDYLLLEVGLGGRLDAVNIFDADYVALTSISRDHENILGTGYRKILHEKMGVTRLGGNLISSLELLFLREEIANNYKLNWIDLFELGLTQDCDDYTTRNKKLAMATFLIATENKVEIENLKQKFETIDYSPSGFKGRFEKVTWEERCFIFIGAHNIDGVRKMASHALVSKSRIDYIWCSFSKRPKEEMINSLLIFTGFAPTYLSPFAHFKAATESEIQDVYSDIRNASEKKQRNAQIHYPLFFAGDMFDTLKRFEKNKIILVTGSYYFIGEVQKLLSRFDGAFVSQDLGASGPELRI